MNFSQNRHLPILVAAILLLLTVTLNVLSFSLDFTYEGNILRHFAMETFGGFVAVSAAAMAYNSAIYQRTILLPYLSAALLSVGFIDIFHAALSVDYFNVVLSENSYFIPGSWTAGRTVLSMVLLLGLLNYKVFPKLKISTPLLFTLSLVVSAVLLLVMINVKLPAFILNDYFIHRPWELIPVLFFLASLIIIYKYRATFPAAFYGYGFFIISIIVQLIMALSLELYSALFDISHILKVVSYIYIGVPLFILMERRSKKSLRVAVGRTQAYLTLSIIFGMLILMNMHAYFLTNEKESIDNLKEQRSALCLSQNVFNSHERFPSTLTDEDSNKKIDNEYQKYACAYNHYERIFEEYNIDIKGFISHYYSLFDKMILAKTNNDKYLYKSLYTELNNYAIDKINPLMQRIIIEESEQIMAQSISDKQTLNLYITLFFLLALTASPFIYLYLTNTLSKQFKPLRDLSRHMESIHKTGKFKELALENTYGEVLHMKKRFNQMIDSVLEYKKMAQAAQEGLEEELVERTASLALARDHLKRVVNNVGDAIITADTKGKIESVNKAGLDMFGYELSQLMGKNVKILQPEHIVVRHDDILKRYLKTGEGRLMGKDAIEATAKRKNGELFPIEISITETKEKNDHTFIALIKDITLRKDAEKAIKELKERMIKFIDSSSEGLFFHENGIITDANVNALSFLGMSIADVEGHHINEYFRMKDVDCQEKRVKGQHYECTIVHVSGSKRLVDIIEKDITIDNVKYHVMAMRDIGDLHYAINEVEQHTKELQSLIYTTNTPIFGIDTEGNINEWNKAAEELTHYIKDEVYGRNLVEVYITEEHKDSVKDVLQDALQGKETSNYEFPLYSKEGSRRIILLNATPRRDIDGNITGVIGIGQDITQIDISRKQLAQERKSLQIKVEERTKELEKSLVRIKDSNLQLENINRHKSEFISSMSHELRTPLNGIIGIADLLHEQLFGELNTKQLSYTEQIVKSADHLLSLINDILDMAKIDAGSMDLTTERIDIKEWIRNTVGIMNTEFRKKHINVHTDISFSRDYIMADIRKCNQIMINLLSNAVKYTPEGSDIFMRISDEGSDYIMVEIEDCGIGVKKEDFTRIFDEFYQSDRSRDEQLGGTGIGLALTKRLVEMHGGKIGVKPAKQGGALFFFTLPVTQKELGPSCDAREIAQENNLLVLPATPQKKILIAEDNQVNASILLDMLNNLDYRTAVVENGQMAIDMIMSCKPDLILMDMEMPVMSGLEATRKIREMPEFADVPIIAITASVTEESKKKQLATGCTDHLSKPIKRKDLLSMISKYIEPDDTKEEPLC